VGDKREKEGVQVIKDGTSAESGGARRASMPHQRPTSSEPEKKGGREDSKRRGKDFKT